MNHKIFWMEVTFKCLNLIRMYDSILNEHLKKFTIFQSGVSRQYKATW